MEFNKQTSTTRSSASEAIIDQGLRAYMLKVYNYMASGVLLTGVISLLVFKFSGGMNITLGPSGFNGLTDPFGELLFNSGFKWLVMLAPLGIVMYLSFGISKMSASKAQSTFWVFAALMGASLASIFIVCTVTPTGGTAPPEQLQGIGTTKLIGPITQNKASQK